MIPDKFIENGIITKIDIILNDKESRNTNENTLSIENENKIQNVTINKIEIGDSHEKNILDDEVSDKIKQKISNEYNIEVQNITVALR